MGSVIFFNKMGVGGFHERKKSSRGHNHQGSMLKAKYIKKKRSNEVLELDEPMSEIQLMPRSRPNQSSVTFQEGYHHVLTGRRAVTFACIGLVAAVIVIGMSFIPYQFTHINISNETKVEKGICDNLESYQTSEIPEETEINPSDDFIAEDKLNETMNDETNNTIQISDDSYLPRNIRPSGEIIAKYPCYTWSSKNILSSEIWFGVIFGISAFATLLAGFRPTGPRLICCLIFSIISVITSLVLLFYSVIWHSFSMVISIVQGIISFICLIMTSKDVCHISRTRNEIP